MATVFVDASSRIRSGIGPGPGRVLMARPRAVLVTGSAGRIGRAVVAELLTRGHRVRGFDRVPSPGLPDSAVGDLTSRRTSRERWRGSRP